MKKKIIFLLTLAIMTVALAVSAFATVSISFDVEDATTDTGVACQKIVLTQTDDEGDWRSLQTKIKFNYDKIIPVDWYDGTVPAYSGESSEYPFVFSSFKNGRTSTGELQRPQYPVWTIDGANSEVIVELYWPSLDTYPITANNTVIYEMYFKYAEGVTKDNLVASDFDVYFIQYGSTHFYGNADASKNDIVLTNNVVPEAVAITIPVLEGDKIYLQDGTVVTAESAGDYEVPAEVGYVVVNSGKTTLNVAEDDDFSGTFQKTYYIDGTAALEAHVNAVVGSDALSLRDHSDVINSAGENLGDRNGMRFQMLSSQSSRKDAKYPIVESGFIMTAETSKVLGQAGVDYVLNMEMVNNELAKKGVAYNSADGTDIRMDSNDEVIDIRGVFYNIPITEAGVQTVIVARPYYQIGEGDNATYIYGEITKSTLYDIAQYLKENKWDECEESLQEYINEIVGLVEGFEEIIEDEVIIDIGSLYN